jgi:hypothetical protein
VIDAAPLPPGEAEALRWELLAGGGGVLPTPATVSPFVSLEGHLLLGRRWRPGLLAAFSFGGSTPVVDTGVTRGSIATRTLLALPAFSVCSDTLLVTCAGALAGLRLTFGDSSGSLLFQSSFQVAAEPTAGLQLDVTLPLRAFRLALALGALLNPAQASLGITGLPSSAVKTPLLEGFVQLRIGLGSGVP